MNMQEPTAWALVNMFASNFEQYRAHVDKDVLAIAIS